MCVCVCVCVCEGQHRTERGTFRKTVSNNNQWPVPHEHGGGREDSGHARRGLRAVWYSLEYSRLPFHIGLADERARPPVQNFFVPGQTNQTEPNRTEPNRTESNRVQLSAYFLSQLTRSNSYYVHNRRPIFVPDQTNQTEPRRQWGTCGCPPRDMTTPRHGIAAGQMFASAGLSSTE
jgi:hypothetical protein